MDGDTNMSAMPVAGEWARPQGRVSRVLIWLLLIATVACWAAMVAATVATYREAAPLPQRMVDARGATI